MGSMVNGIYLPSNGEAGWGNSVSDNFRRQSENHINVKAYGAVGNGTADDTAGIQAACNVALGIGGNVHIPPGDYKVTSTIDLGITGPIRISGSLGAHNTGLWARVFGNIAGPIFSRGNASNLAGPIIEDLAVQNTNAAGTGILYTQAFAPCGVHRCYVSAYRGIVVEGFDTSLQDNRIVSLAGNPSGSIGIAARFHTTMLNNDVTGFDHGYRLCGTGLVVHGGRTEINKVGIMLGRDIDNVSLPLSGTSLSGLRMEANDIGIQFEDGAGVSIAGVSIQGSGNAPSGQSIRGIYSTGGAQYTTMSACIEGGTHSTAFIDFSGANQRVTMIDCAGAAFLIPQGQDVDLIGCKIGTHVTSRQMGTIATTGIISPSQLTGNVNDWNPTGLSNASVVRVQSNGAYNITGLQAGEDGQIIRLLNISGFALTLVHESASSSAANRFACPSGANVTLNLAGGIEMIYDNTAPTRWRVLKP